MMNDVQLMLLFGDDAYSDEFRDAIAAAKMMSSEQFASLAKSVQDQPKFKRIFLENLSQKIRATRTQDARAWEAIIRQEEESLKRLNEKSKQSA